MLGEFIHSFLYSFVQIERRTEPFWRPQANRLLREPAAALLQTLIHLQRRHEGLALAEEKEMPGEEAALDKIIRDMGEYMLRKYRNGDYERGGNTKTHGLVRAEVTIREDVPTALRHGIFREPRTFPAYIRFAGPGPDSPPDIDDVGFQSMSIKLMGVPGPKLLEDEKNTQDLLCVSTPTFVTPNVVVNQRLHAQSLTRTPLFYFFDPRQTHILDFLMQALWNETQTSPLECQYWSCTPYLLGEGRAMVYSMKPRDPTRSSVPDLPRRPPDNYLRDNLVKALAERDVYFELLVQLQTDSHRMPIENAAVRWPEKLSPWVPVADIKIPKQVFDTPGQLRFASQLSFTPWHCIPEHRPLGNQNRARRRMYWELSRLRLRRNQLAHVEPTGAEKFDEPEDRERAQAIPSDRRKVVGGAR